MINWKSALSGAVTAAAGLILALHAGGVVMPQWLVVTAGYVQAGGLLSLGVAAKDHDVTGGTRVQPSTIAPTVKP